MAPYLLTVTSLVATAATGALAAPPPAPAGTPFFSVIREGPGQQKAIGIKNPLGEDIALSRMAIGRKFSATQEEQITQLDSPKIVDALYSSRAGELSVLDAGNEALYCDGKSYDSRRWWGDYDVCQWTYRELTNFNEDDVLKLYLDGEVVDVYGDEADLKVSSVCGVPLATKDGTLVRKLSVLRGNTAPLGSFGTNPENCEWEVTSFPQYFNRFFYAREAAPREAGTCDPRDSFSQYVQNYLCDSDADCARVESSIGGSAVCVKKSFETQKYCVRADAISDLSSRDSIPFQDLSSRDSTGNKCIRGKLTDNQCRRYEYCSVNDECRSFEEQMKVRADKENVEIAAGATETFTFQIDEIGFNYVAIAGVLNIVSSVNPENLELKWGSTPIEDLYTPGLLVGSPTFISTKCGAFTTTYDNVKPVFDERLVGDWSITITNTGTEHATVQGAFWAVEVQAD